MVGSRSLRAGGRGLVCVALLVALVAGPTLLRAQAAQTRLRADYPPLQVWYGQPPYVRNFNFMFSNFSSQPAEVTWAMYEPLFVYNTVGYTQHPWLATAARWSPDHKVLTFTIRHGVRWSDGVPMTARDVLYTLSIGRDNPKLNVSGHWGPSGIFADVTMPASDQVAIHFKMPQGSDILWSIANNTWVVPEHIWSKVKDLLTWTNPNPVVTGPFSIIKDFTSTSFELDRNPYYWQPGKPYFDRMRIIAYNSSDAGNLDLFAGKIDWTQSYLPNASKVYDARNPHFHSYFAPVMQPDQLMLNDSIYPYSLPVLRQAMSEAINRQEVDIAGTYGYQPPSDVTGLTDSTFHYGLYPGWVDKTLPQTLVHYNPQAARALLKSDGFTWQNGQLVDPKGHKVAFDLLAINTALGAYIGEAQIVAQNLKDIGIDATIKTVTYAAYFPLMQATPPHFVAAINGASTYPSANSYFYYQCVLSPSTVDWEQWSNPEMTKLTEEYNSTFDHARQVAIVHQEERIWVDNLPVIPLVTYVAPEEYNTTNYTGFPSKDNYYANGTQWGQWNDGLLSLTTIHPSHQ